MIVKCMAPDGKEFLFDHVSSLATVSQQFISDGERFDFDHDVIDTEKTKIDPVRLFLVRPDYNDVYIVSDFPVYVMNDSGQTVQSYSPDIHPLNDQNDLASE